MCVREEGRLKGLCLLFFELGLYVGFLWGCALFIVPELASSTIPTLARTRGPDALKPGCGGPWDLRGHRRTLCACRRYWSLNMHLVDLHVPTSRQRLELHSDLQSRAATPAKHTAANIYRPIHIHVPLLNTHNHVNGHFQRLSVGQWHVKVFKSLNVGAVVVFTGCMSCLMPQTQTTNYRIRKHYHSNVSY